jgi:UDP-N-acetylmuramoylalanine--D-glutamate ligase
VAGDTGDESMDRAVQAGLDALTGQGAATGGTVLLAPIGTSFDQFRDYRARGDSFSRAARALAARPEEGA